jgi:hypothetical protein
MGHICEFIDHMLQSESPGAVLVHCEYILACHPQPTALRHGLVLDDSDKHWHFVNPIAPEIDPILTIEPHR